MRLFIFTSSCLSTVLVISRHRFYPHSLVLSRHRFYPHSLPSSPCPLNTHNITDVCLHVILIYVIVSVDLSKIVISRHPFYRFYPISKFSFILDPSTHSDIHVILAFTPSCLSLVYSKSFSHAIVSIRLRYLVLLAPSNPQHTQQHLQIHMHPYSPRRCCVCTCQILQIVISRHRFGSVLYGSGPSPRPPPACGPASPYGARPALVATAG